MDGVVELGSTDLVCSRASSPVILELHQISITFALSRNGSLSNRTRLHIEMADSREMGCRPAHSGGVSGFNVGVG